MKRFLQSWVINTLAVLVAVSVLPHRIHYGSWVDLLAASLLLGIFNAVLRPILMLLTFPILLMTLGLFRFVINALLLLLVGFILPNFFVDGFWAAFWGALVISIISTLLNILTGGGGTRVRVHRRRPPPDSPGDGGGPVIDV